VFASARWEARTASSTRDGVHVGSERRVEDVVGFVILKSGHEDDRRGGDGGDVLDWLSISFYEFSIDKAA
jgi:hypothetical protein